MPSLSNEQQRQLKAEPPMKCHICGMVIRNNYCRECDEFFYEGHDPNCSWLNDPNNREDHRGHRTY